MAPTVASLDSLKLRMEPSKIGTAITRSCRLTFDDGVAMQDRSSLRTSILSWRRTSEFTTVTTTKRVSLYLSGVAAALSLLAGCAQRPANEAAETAGVTVFEGARLITGEPNPPIEDSVFIIQNDRFMQVGRRGEVQVPPGAS